jgi:translation initiation factor IF-3
LLKSRKGRVPARQEDLARINDGIRVSEVRLVDAEGEQVGVVSIAKALQLAKEAGLDLVEVAAQAKPPVCRIMDYGKFRFEQSKKEKVAKKNQTVIKVKEIKFHPKTADNDYTYRVKQATDFLEKGNKVKMTVFFRGREMAHQDYGRRLLDRAKEDLQEIGDLEMDYRMEGNIMTIIFSPKKSLKKPVSKETEATDKSEAPKQD